MQRSTFFLETRHRLISGILGKKAGPGTRVVALRDINLSISPQEVFGLVGPNGAGKTTLIRILSGFVLPEAGTATVNGFDIYSQPYDVLRSVSLIIPRSGFHRWVSVEQNLLYYARMYGSSRKEAERRVAEALELEAAIEPILQITVFAVVGIYVDRLGGSGLVEKFGYGGDYLTFVMTGLIFTTVFRESQNAAARAVESVKGTMELIVATRMSIPTFIAVRIISRHINALRDVPAMILVAVLFGARLSGRINLAVFLASLLLTVAVLSSISILLGSVSMAITRAGGVLEEIPSFLYWLNTGIVPFFSGAIFPMEELPKSLRTISLLLPHTYGLRLVRSSTTTTSFDPTGDLIALGLFLLILGPASLAALKLALRRAKRIGSMSSW